MDNNELERREQRRKRRKRSTVIAYLILIVLLVGIGVVGYFGVIEIKQLKTDYDERVLAGLEEASTEAALEESATEEASTDTEVTKEVVEEVAEPEDTTDELDELVDVLIADMTLEEKIAGLFIVSPESLTGVTTQTAAGNATKTAIEENPVGGFIFTSKNYTSKSQFQEMLTNMKTYAKFPLFMAVDQEPGSDTSFGLTQSDAQSAISDAATAGAVYSIFADGLSDAYLNMVFSPLADIVSEDGNSSLQGRTFGNDAEAAKPLVAAAVNSIEDTMSAVAKTFPGEGSVNSDKELTKSAEELKNAELISFEGALNASSIIVSNLYATGITGEKIPACLSSDVITLLRDYLGYSGIIMTDYLNEETVTANYLSADAAIAAINAGCDLLLCPKNYKEAYNALFDAVNNGELSEERINESLHRIYRVKYKEALDE